MVKILRDPYSHLIAAQLNPEQEVIILDEHMKKNIAATGIAVSSKFKQENNSDWYIYPSDDKKIFAKAFEQIYFVHGLQQQGYYWEDKEVSENLNDEELAKKVLEQYFNNKTK